MLDSTTSDLIHVSSVDFPAGDTSLSGTLFLPSGAPRAAVVLNGATGVPHMYYKHFAYWLAAQRGIACLIYDYSDFGASAQRPLQQSRATMLSWALVDQPAARAEMRRRLPGVPIWVIGHSLGAMLLPMQDGIEDIERVIAVASGYVHHTDHVWSYQILARLFWFGHVPLLTRLLGYMPGEKIGFGGNLPADVYWQWRSWCTSKTFFWPEVGQSIPEPDWDRSGAPVRLMAFADDATIPAECVWRMERSYGAKHCDRVLVRPSDHGLSHVGHIGMFARRNAAMWPGLVNQD